MIRCHWEVWLINDILGEIDNNIDVERPLMQQHDHDLIFPCFSLSLDSYTHVIPSLISILETLGSTKTEL